MCGIVGILGTGEATPKLLKSLRRLEYRGYDSAGIATINSGRIESRRAVGVLNNLVTSVDSRPTKGAVGIGHTRWATHGRATVENAHPHRSGSVSVVHNGIIENFRELKADLAGSGYAFKSDTDTETASVLCRKFLDQGHAPVEAARMTVKSLRGSFALLFLFSDEDDLLFAARRGSPLVVGHGDGEMFVASDEIALAGLTETATHLEDGDCACISRQGLHVTDCDGRPIHRSEIRIRVGEADSGKGSHDHYMEKEILEQPAVLADELRQYLPESGGTLLPVDIPDFGEIDRIALVACGTANFACQVAAYWFEQLARIPAHAEIASEFRYGQRVLNERTLAIFVSQSGETADTLAALRHANENGCPNIAVLNSATSSMSRDAGSVMAIHAGVEIGVASTKAFSCQLAALAILAIVAAGQRGELDSTQEDELLRQLRGMPVLVGAALESRHAIRMIADDIAKCRNALFMGRGVMYPVALEGALKLKEISYIHAEGLASGELKHGPIALVDEDLPVVVLAPPGRLLEKTLSNLEEVKARQGKVILLADSTTAELHREEVRFSVALPECDPMFAPIVYAVPLQLLAYHAAVALGTDVDRPRNLAKSVTVE